MSLGLSVAIATFFAVGGALSMALKKPGNVAPRFAILWPLLVASFLFFESQLYGQLPLPFIVVVAGVGITPLAFARFCARCGAMRGQRARGFGDTTSCRRCGSSEFRTLWVACLHGPRDAGA